MLPSTIILYTVVILVILGVNGVGWFTVVDEWVNWRRGSALFGGTLLALLDLLLTAVILRHWGL